jgi:hypothetical protein
MKLNDRALREAVAASEVVIKNVLGISVRGRQLDRIVERIVAAYQLELSRQSFHPHNTSPVTIALGSMQVGDELRFNETGLQLYHLHNYIKTARKMLNAPMARWRIHEPYRGTFVVQRLADNAHAERDPFKNRKAVALAAIPLGLNKGAYIEELQSVHELGPSVKKMAQRILNNPDANWSGRTTNQGVFVTRIK